MNGKKSVTSNGDKKISSTKFHQKKKKKKKRKKKIGSTCNQLQQRINLRGPCNHPTQEKHSICLPQKGASKRDQMAHGGARSRDPSLMAFLKGARPAGRKRKEEEEREERVCECN